MATLSWLFGVSADPTQFLGGTVMGTSRRIAYAVIAAITCAGISACGDSAKPTTTVDGSFVLTLGWAYLEPDGTPIRPSELASDANPAIWRCTGISGFSDVAENSVVSMLDGSGKTLASGKVIGTETTPGADNRQRCVLHWKIEHAPTGVVGAQVRIGQHPASALNADYDTRWATVNLVQ